MVRVSFLTEFLDFMYVILRMMKKWFVKSTGKIESFLALSKTSIETLRLVHFVWCFLFIFSSAKFFLSSPALSLWLFFLLSNIFETSLFLAADLESVGWGVEGRFFILVASWGFYYLEFLSGRVFFLIKTNCCSSL